MEHPTEVPKDTDSHSESKDFTLEDLKDLLPEGCEVERLETIDDLRAYAKQFKKRKNKER